VNTLGFLSRTNATEFLLRRVAPAALSIVVVGSIAVTLALMFVNTAHAATPSDVFNTEITSPSHELYRGPHAPT